MDDTSNSSHERILSFILAGLILCYSCNSDRYVKGTCSARSTFLLHRDNINSIATAICSRHSCAIMSGDISRIHTASSSTVSATISLITTSRRRLYGSVPVAATIAEVRVASIVDVIVAVEVCAFLVVYQLLLVALHFLDNGFCSNLPLWVFI